MTAGTSPRHPAGRSGRLVRRTRTGAALLGAGVVITALMTAPARATPSPSCWAGITATGGVGSCRGATNGGSFYQLHVTCQLVRGQSFEYTLTSQVTYAAPSQPGVVVQVDTCGLSTSAVTNAWMTSW
ncbi:hypothetical protein [Nonomuraea sp. SBT364]|uniref:hypothetical protein n=1 Tax=Nonomuraea sp. SBT364 TaxID=1580530 RepID=UPI00066CC049|nr:hypothetical protein [Nonomuraea sp. SBT364]